ncbi:unnamed protein product [marine sediment metagenome]|uniref:Uncharacterized protein n=1 Tax=marine sediment metagenome TaxID=412755 RepID=X0T6K3_9ZZZZ
MLLSARAFLDNFLKINEISSAMIEERKIRDIDIENAAFYITHIKNPCVDWKTGLNLRDYYIREIKNVIETLEDPATRFFLRSEIEKYRSKDTSFSVRNNILQSYLM